MADTNTAAQAAYLLPVGGDAAIRGTVPTEEQHQSEIKTLLDAVKQSEEYKAHEVEAAKYLGRYW